MAIRTAERPGPAPSPISGAMTSGSGLDLEHPRPDVLSWPPGSRDRDGHDGRPGAIEALLAEWRAAERAVEALPVGSPERDEALAARARLREVYQHRFAELTADWDGGRWDVFA